MERIKRFHIDCGFTEKKYCDVCGEIVIDEDEQGFFGVFCSCEKAKQEQEAIEFQLRGQNKKKEIRLNNLKRLSQMSDKMLSSTIENFVVEDEHDRKLKETIEKIISSEKLLSNKRNGLIFLGETGLGKTFAMCCIANAYFKRDTELIYTNPIRVKEIAVSSLRMAENDDFRDFERLKNIQLLIIDDFGVEKETDFHNEKIYDIIDYRYQNRLPIWITTNLTYEELINCYDMQKRRIYERLIEVSTIIEFTGKNKRKPQKMEI